MNNMNRSLQGDFLDKEKDLPAQKDFLDFELEIGGQKSDRSYEVDVIRSAAGEAHRMMQLPLDDPQLQIQLLKLQNALLRSGATQRNLQVPQQQDHSSIQDFGRTLFNCLFTGEVAKRYVASQLEAAHQGKGLRLKIRILAAEIAALPWEFLYDPDNAEYLCLSHNTPVVRYIELPRPPRPLPVTLPLRILGMIATPNNLPPLDAKREQQRIEQAIESAQQRGLVQLTWLPGHTWRDVQQAMRRAGPWHIFHFIGHGSFNPGSDEGLIAFEDEQRQANMLPATQLARLLADHSSLRLVVLNACEGAESGHTLFSSTASILVRRGIPAVLAMQYPITDAAATAFSRAFYEALCDGMPVDAAVNEARITVSLERADSPEWGIPVLFMHSPDGVLFTIDRGSTSTPPSVPREAPTPGPAPQPPQSPLPLPAGDIPAGVRPVPQPSQSPRRLPVIMGVLVLLALLGIGGLIFALYRPSTSSPTNTQQVPSPSTTLPPASPTARSGAYVQLKPFYSGTATGYANATITFTLESEDQQGKLRMQTTFQRVDDPRKFARYSCQGEITLDRHLHLTCSDQAAPSYRLAIDGVVFSDGHMEGTEEATSITNPNYDNFYHWSVS